MAYYAITYVYAVPRSRRSTVRLTANTLVRRFEAGNLIVSGPLLDGETPAGALLIAKVDSVEAAEKLVAGDPMNIGGAVLSHTITEWNPVLGTI